jgi:two-component system phosphate regulon response regulator PhoB
MPRVLLVEDDTSMGRTLVERLMRDSLDVAWAQTIADAEKHLGAGTWDLAILDVKLPDGSGFGLARRIKKTSTVPVMFMTAQNSAEARLEGFEIGADEYLPKPFHLKEFLIRVRHVLARQQPRRAFRCGGVTIDLDLMTVETPAGARTQLQVRDSRVLKLLIDAAPRPVERSVILDRVWGEERFPTPRTVDNAVVRLRQALGDDDGAVIRSVRGVGYQWAGGEPS